jgi:TorA maturation chaperone TorD
MDEKTQSHQEVEYNLNEAIRVRGDIYAFLSRGYKKEVDEDYLRNIEEIVPALERLSADSEDEVLNDGVKCLKEFVGSIQDRPEMLEELNRRYTTLFLGVGYKDTVDHVNPFESVYLSPEHLVMQEQRDEVVEFYARFGMGVNKEDFKEPEDHICAELSFISGMSNLTLTDLGEGDTKEAVEKLKAQKEFMFGHLLRWVHLLCKDLREAAKEGFYKSLADITMGFVRMDIKFLEGMIEMIEEQNKKKVS